MSDKKKRNTGLVVSCWIVAFIVIFIFFVINQDSILSNLKNTRFFERVFGTTPTFIKNHEEKEPAKNKEIEKDNEQPELKLETSDVAEKESPITIVETKPETKPVEEEKKDSTKEEVTEKETPVEDTKKVNEKEKNVEAKTEIKKEVAVPAYYNASMCFIVIDNDGTVSRKVIIRKMAKSDSPLIDILNALIKGPTFDEKGKGCMTLIPDGTRLLSATVRDGVAYISFSDEFEFNKVGVEGYLAQLMQIVYTATQFSTVKSVQFLINGQKKEYLGSEGVWIGSPLSQSTFK